MPDSIAAQDKQKSRVLVIDDSRLMRVTIKRVLKNEFDIIEAEDGEQGWGILTGDEHIRVVLTDASMPRLDGYELISRIRHSNDRRLQEIPIIMVTSADEQEQRDRALETGASDFIVKPFDKTQLLARVRSYAKLDRTSKELAQASISLAETSSIDQLSQVNSRNYFILRGEQDLAFAKRHGKGLSVIALGIDNFRQFVENYSKSIGDEIIVWTAKIIKDLVRKEDTVARVSEHTFAIIVPAAGRLEAAVLSERVRKKIASSSFSKSDISIPVSISLGLACFVHEQSQAIEELLKTAEKRLNYAERSGGNRLIASDPEEKPETAAAPKITDVEQALRMLAAGEESRVIPSLPILAQRLLPLLSLCNQELNWDADELVAVIKNKLHLS
jgi:two-component system cell cycle response regulator